MKPTNFKRVRQVSPQIQQVAKQLRKELTPAERQLWNLLRGRRVQGLYFRRQHPIGRYIADFCAPRIKLIIELDGGIHAHQRERDHVRTRYLQALGYHLIRYSNEFVLKYPHEVLRQIGEAAVARLKFGKEEEN